MPPPAHVTSYYAATANQSLAFPALTGAIEADVCVIGAGYTGLSAALHLAERGYRVVVLEANRVGWGASGRNGGQALTGLAPGMPKVAAWVGMADAKRLWELTLEAVELQRTLIGRHGIACDYRRGSLLAATRRAHLAELAAELELLAGQWGYGAARLVGAPEVAGMLATGRYAGGLLDQGGAHLHPLNYALGLARAAAAAGAAIFEDSGALAIKSGPKPLVRCGSGEVRARHVALCVNAYLDGLAPTLSGAIMPVGTYILATGPLGPARAAGLIRDGICVSDTNAVLDYFRLSADHRLLFGGRASYTGREPRALRQSLRRRMLKVFPQLADAPIDFVWGGHVAITRSRLPQFGRADSNVFYAHGFSGQGVALTTLAGKLIAEAVAGTAERFDLFARLPHRRFPGGPCLRTPLLALGAAWYRLRDLV